MSIVSTAFFCLTSVTIGSVLLSLGDLGEAVESIRLALVVRPHVRKTYSGNLVFNCAVALILALSKKNKINDFLTWISREKKREQKNRIESEELLV